VRLLLDTCTFLWWTSAEDRIPVPTLEALQEDENEVILSVSSAWEIAIKSKLGRLELPAPALAFVQEASELYRLTILPVELEDAVRAGELPLHHNDPFDRLLVAQAMIRDVDLVSPDVAFRPYGIRTIW
jgi:PIN domain nuclease of toxin-antitoxin system